ncbi:MAG: glycogen synthase GlgA [Ignavibacteriaceae bacterium]
MKIAFIASEVIPYAKTGGLADVAGTLPKALEKLGCEVKVFMPKYYSFDEVKYGLHYCWDIGEMPVRISNHIRSVHLHQAKLPDSNVEINFIDCPHYFHRGHLYTNDHDEDERFILFCKGVIETLQRLKWAPDVIHCNDWQTGLLPLFIKDNYNWDRMFDKTASLYTIHNIGYQGRFSRGTMFNAEIKGSLFFPGGPIEHENTVSFMKAGIVFSDVISTVSETYAREILTPEYGAGMDRTLNERKDDLYGILNGIDYSVWNPETDPLIPVNYSYDTIEKKLENKKFLLEHLNLPFDESLPLIGIVSRMVSQKGFDIFAGAVNDLMSLDAQWVILGSGEEHFENFFRSLSGALSHKVVAYIGFNNELSHLIEAGADIFLMPSRYEPCGLNQMYSLKYGTIPVVRKTGGLADTVNDWHEYQSKGLDTGTGFSFNDYTSYALSSSVKRAISLFPDKKVWNKMQKNGMAKDFTWENSADKYTGLYRKAMEKRS